MIRMWVLRGALPELSGDKRTGRGGTHEQALTSLVMKTSDAAKSAILVMMVSGFMWHRVKEGLEDTSVWVKCQWLESIGKQASIRTMSAT